MRGFFDDVLQYLAGLFVSACPLQEEGVLMPGFEIGEPAVHFFELIFRCRLFAGELEGAGVFNVGLRAGELG
jgi:hypothetical protein